MASVVFAVATISLIVSTLSMEYKENIRDFLPFDDDNATAMEIYQDITGANRIYAVVSGTDGILTDELTGGVDALLENVAARDSLGLVARTVATVDDEVYERVMETVYRLMPVLLTDEDYDRIDSLLAQPDIVGERVAAVKESLQMPVSGMIIDNMSRDPLGLFSVVTDRLRSSAGNFNLDTDNGYIVSADGTDAFVMFESSSGANESGLNGMLVDMLEDAAAAVMEEHKELDITFTGAPVIAVGNARCIKEDSLLCVVVAGLIIMALLIYVFRSARNIALIFVSVGWGWLLAMGTIAFFYDSVSVIVVGIASVMLGIAVNYPLHLVDHLSGCADKKTALSQIVAPLVVGNVTTVGAFLCLVPLDSPALHDLGLFSSILLTGTILFVLVFLPHVVKARPGKPAGDTRGPISRIASVDIKFRPSVLWGLGLLTVIFGLFGLNVSFDSDLRDINYMTDGHKELFDRLGKMFDAGGDDRRVYISSGGTTWDDAVVQFERTGRAIDSLVGNGLVETSPLLSGFIVSRETQNDRLKRWNAIAAKRDTLMRSIGQVSRCQGFGAGAFDMFGEVLGREYGIAGETEFAPLAETLLMGNVSKVDGRYSVVDAVTVPDGVDKDSVIKELKHCVPDGTIVFDVAGMNGAITGTLASDFNYIGFACGVIVFIFLWLSMGRIELAIVSFLPMAVSWVWILGIMGMLGIQFNIVNVILATFIFGQGDDYTIFVTEGLCYEHACGRRVLARFRSSIVVSALIMFVGMGVLVFAHHPAMRSLGQVAVIGMVTVVVMAYVIPPLTFGFLVRCGDRLRYRPLTLGKLWYNILWRLTRRFSRHVPGVTVDVVEIGPADDGYCVVGAELIMPEGERFYSPGRVTLVVGAGVSCRDRLWRRYVTVDDVCRVVLDRYLYKGVEVWRNAHRAIKDIRQHDAGYYHADGADTVFVDEPGQGELSLVTALLNPGVKVVSRPGNAYDAELLECAADGVVGNLCIDRTFLA